MKAGWMEVWAASLIVRLCRVAGTNPFNNFATAFLSSSFQLKLASPVEADR